MLPDSFIFWADQSGIMSPLFAGVRRPASADFSAKSPLRSLTDPAFQVASKVAALQPLWV
jgi:hypothetical protein